MRLVKQAIKVGLAFGLLPALVLWAWFWRRQPGKKIPRLCWGPVPLISNKYWSAALKERFFSETFMWNHFDTINKEDDFDLYIKDIYRAYPNFIRPYLAAFKVIKDYDIIHIPVSGGSLSNTPICYFEGWLYRMSGIKVIVIPYGADAYCYSKIKNPAWQHGLICSYPALATAEREILRKLRYWEENADAVIPGVMGGDGFARWDVLVPSQIVTDIEQWKAKKNYNDANGVDGVVRICHAPNHRGCKGTEYVVQAVEQLRDSGLQVELLLLEKMKNECVRQIFHDQCDILIEQLLVDGYAMTAIEGMSTGLPVLGNIGTGGYSDMLRWFSFLGECPIVGVNPDTLEKILRTLITKPDSRRKLGQAGRVYAEKYHSYKTAQYLFSAVYDRVWFGKEVDLINLFHPIYGKYSEHRPKVEHHSLTE